MITGRSVEVAIYTLTDRLRPWATVKRTGSKNRLHTGGQEASTTQLSPSLWMFLLVLKVPEKISFAHNSRSSFEFYLFSTVFYVCVCLRKRAGENECVCVQCWIPAESISISDLCVGAMLNISSMIFQLLLFTPYKEPTGFVTSPLMPIWIKQDDTLWKVSHSFVHFSTLFFCHCVHIWYPIL